MKPIEQLEGQPEEEAFEKIDLDENEKQKVAEIREIRANLHIKEEGEYHGIGRKLLMVDELPLACLAYYEKDPGVKSYIIERRGEDPTQFCEGDDVIVPLLYPDFDGPPIARQEDAEVLTAISSAVISTHSLTTKGKIDPSNLNIAMALLEEHELVAAKIVVHPCHCDEINKWDKEFFDKTPQQDEIMAGLYGHFWSADIHVSTMVPRNTIYVLAPGDYVGVMPLRSGCSEFGVVIINDYAISKVTVIDE